jgi:radical SAM protein with 4Fe4S-binding SPASM domain
MHPHRPRHDHVVVVCEDITEATTGSHSALCNHCGAAAPFDFQANGKQCAKPFRELAIRWDGNVALCCNDFRGEYRCGNVLERPLDTIWQSAPFRVARMKLYHGERDFVPCWGCNAMSKMVGLLPDGFGQDELAKAGPKEAEVIDRALGNGPLSDVVLRPWEAGFVSAESDTNGK